MTLFSEILRGCGLSQREAADFLGIRPDTVKGYASPSRPQQPPPGVLAELHELAARQERMAQATVDIFESQAAEYGPADTIELGIAADDHEAQQLGLPCVGAHLAVARRVWELLPPEVRIVIVPRGSTPTTAMAADMRERGDG